MSFREYVKAGWQLVSFAPGTKGPEGPSAVGWNLRANAITDPQRVNGMVQGGLLHSYSGTACLDIDNLEVARPWLLERGVDLDAMLAARDAVQIVSGRKNRAKLLYRLVTPLVSKKLCRYSTILDDYHAIELRCATRNGRSVQDVLPPSVHPDTGKPYEWKYGCDLTGHWSDLPELPDALLKLWQAEGADVTEGPVIEEAATGELPPDSPLAEMAYYLDAIEPGAYDDWLAVGMAVHHETAGAPEGLALWDTWSRRSPKYGESKDGRPPQYPADKWPSFTLSTQDRTIGSLKLMAAAAGQSPYAPLEAFPVAEDEEFKQPAETPSGLPPGPGEDTRPGAKIRKILAPLVYVTSQERYYDIAEGHYLTEKGVDNMYTARMPLMPIGAGGAPKRPKPSEILCNTAWSEDGGWRERVYSSGLHPGAGRFFHQDGRRYLNTYEPTPIEPLEPRADELEAFNFLWARPGEKVFRNWLLQFYAHALQKPGLKIRAAPLTVGHVTGSGKSTLMRVLPELLFTRRYVTTMTSEGLREQFNDSMAKAWWVHFEEMHSGNAKGERVSVFNKVKPWITEDAISVRPMYGSRYDMPNRVQFTAASNYEDDALHVDDQDRRWAVGRIAEKMTQREATDLYAFLESDRAPGVLHHIFKNVSLTGFNPNAPAPDTEAKRVMVRVNYGVWEAEILELISGSVPPFDKDMFVVKDLLPYLRGAGSGATSARIGRVLGRAPFNFEQLASAYGKRLWVWRNVELWKSMSVAARNDYHEGHSGRPEGHAWSDELPSKLAEACGLEDPSVCDLI